VAGSDQLSQKAREAVVDPANDVFLSAASASEIAVKHRMGRLPLPDPPSEFASTQREAHGIEPRS
jgi:PIN domain nuclease of toxin-antitoxin system